MKLSDESLGRIYTQMWAFMKKAKLDDDQLLHEKLCDAVIDVLEGNAATDLTTVKNTLAAGFEAERGKPFVPIPDEPEQSGITSTRARLKDLLSGRPPLHLTDNERLADSLIEARPTPTIDDLGETSLRTVGMVLIAVGVFLLAVLVGGVLSEWLVTR